MPDAQLNKEAIEAHNRLRVKHGCGPLTYDAGLAQTAQTWAEKLSERGAMQHSGSKVYGENLAYRKSTGTADMNGEEATDYWYSEIEQHNFDRNEFQMDSGHFTQVVWKDTTHAGFGKAKSKDGHSVYVVGQYTPPGNVQGMFQTNVSIPGVKVVVDPPPAVQLIHAPEKTEYRKETLPAEETHERIIIIRNVPIPKR